MRGANWLWTTILAVLCLATSGLASEVDSNESIATIIESYEGAPFTGRVLVQRAGRLLHSRTYFQSTHDTDLEATDTRYHLPGLTKAVTAAAIMSLATDGRLNVDEPINNYLPTVFRASHWNPVTVHHLLTHSSGIADYSDESDRYDTAGGFLTESGVGDVIVASGASPLLHEPGARVTFSNVGYLILGRIVESISKQSFGSFVADRLFLPLEMNESTIAASSTDLNGTSDSGAAKIAKSIADPGRPISDADGGLVTTSSDIRRWINLLSGIHQEALASDAVSEILHKHIEIGEGGAADWMGYGLYVGDRMVFNFGIRCTLIVDRLTQIGIVVISDAPHDNSAIGFQILSELLKPPSASEDE